MSYLIYPGVKKSIDYISIIRNAVENYFDLNILDVEKYKVKAGNFSNSKKVSISLIENRDGLRSKRGEARKYFCYFVFLYTGRTHEAIAEFLKINTSTVTFHIHSMQFRTKQEDQVLSDISSRIKQVINNVWKS